MLVVSLKKKTDFESKKKSKNKPLQKYVPTYLSASQHLLSLSENNIAQYWELLFEVKRAIPGCQIYLKIDCLQRHGHLESTSKIPKFLKSSHFEDKRTENTILKFYLLAEI